MKRCNHLIANIDVKFRDKKEIRQRTAVTQLFKIACSEWNAINLQSQHHEIYSFRNTVTPWAYLDKRTSYGSLTYKYCPDCGVKNKLLKGLKNKLKEKWTVERVIEDL